MPGGTAREIISFPNGRNKPGAMLACFLVVTTRVFSDVICGSVITEITPGLFLLSQTYQKQMVQSLWVRMGEEI